MIDYKKLLERFVAHVEQYDYAHPDVGTGMSISAAITYAAKSITEEAARWNSLAAVGLDFNDDVRAYAALAINEKRRRR